MKKIIILVIVIILLVVALVIILRACDQPPPPTPTATPTTTATATIVPPTFTSTPSPTLPDPTKTYTPSPTSTFTPTPTKTEIPEPQVTRVKIYTYGYPGQVWFRVAPSKSSPPVQPQTLDSGIEVAVFQCVNPAGTHHDWIEVVILDSDLFETMAAGLAVARNWGFVFGQFVKPYPCEN